MSFIKRGITVEAEVIDFCSKCKKPLNKCSCYDRKDAKITKQRLTDKDGQNLPLEELSREIKN